MNKWTDKGMKNDSLWKTQRWGNFRDMFEKAKQEEKKECKEEEIKKTALFFIRSVRNYIRLRCFINIVKISQSVCVSAGLAH